MQDLGTRYIQITLGGWDNHQNIYAPNAGIYPSARQLDFGLANLIADLSLIPGRNGRTMLDDTLIVVKGEFGRTVGNITGQQGRDHYFVHPRSSQEAEFRAAVSSVRRRPDGAYVEDPGWSRTAASLCGRHRRIHLLGDWESITRTVRHDDPLGRGFEYIPTTTGYTGKPILELFQ